MDYNKSLKKKTLGHFTEESIDANTTFNKILFRELFSFPDETILKPKKYNKLLLYSSTQSGKESFIHPPKKIKAKLFL